MADPLIGAPKAQPRSKKWVEAGIAKNPAAAKRRIAAARRTRPKRDIRVTMQFQIKLTMAKAVEALSDRFDMSRSRVLAKFVEDGLRKYGNPAEKTQAGLDAPVVHNPFDSFAPPAAEALVPPPTQFYPPTVNVLPGMTAGLPLGLNQTATTVEIEDENVRS